jgi:hypothetical protein
MKLGRSLIIGAVAGVIFSVASAMLWEAVPRGTSARRIFDGIFYPEFVVARRLTDWLAPHNRDQGIAYWLMIHPFYCVFLGAVVAGGIWSLSHVTTNRHQK